MHKYIHIVCLDAPSPPTYGGAIDMFFKIKALASSGLKINLHYFSYHPGRTVSELEQYCHGIYAYERKSFWQTLLTPLPYIVSSRINTDLIDRLNKDDHPVLLEGFHCAGIIDYLTGKKRKIIIRAHNDEAGYYRSLGQVETKLWKKAYFLRESRLLDSYQLGINKSLPVAVLCQADSEVLSQRYGFENIQVVPLFIPWDKVKAECGFGTYCLYHGNLGVAENEAAAEWLVTNVFSSITVPLVIAGRSISTKLLKCLSSYPHISVVHEPSQADLSALISKAHIHVLPSFNTTGVKVKLLHALFNGRFCITNPAGASGLPQDSGLLVLEAAADFQKQINALMEVPYTEHDRQLRHPLLSLHHNASNAIKLSALL
ncbi:MAG: glycosyltransferase family 4 protein [Chitinophagaceae bacterium]